MRMYRRLAVVLSMLAALPSLSSAQAVRNFEDSWFWGIKGGGMTYWTNRVAHATAPLAGADWLITRSRYGMYVALDQAFFTSNATVVAGQAASEPVRIKDNRRATLAITGFPKSFRGVRPYVGLGVAVNWLQQSNFVNATPSDTAIVINEDARSAATALAMLGAQMQVGRFAVFGQGSYVPTARSFLLGGNEMYVFEGGVRINIGSSREKF